MYEPYYLHVSCSKHLVVSSFKWKLHPLPSLSIPTASSLLWQNLHVVPSRYSRLLCHSKLSVRGMETTHLSCLPLVCLPLAGVWVLATPFSFAHLPKGWGKKPRTVFLWWGQRRSVKLYSVWSGAWSWCLGVGGWSLGILHLSLHLVFWVYTILLTQAIQSSVQWIFFRCTN